jgi:uncharacterized protein YecT (DUF1311 family)
MRKLLLLSALLLFAYASKLHSQTQFEMTSDAAKSLQIADNKLNIAYKQLKVEYKDFPVFLQKLKSAQIQWIKYRDALIEMEFPSNQPGIDYGSMYSMCEFYYTKRLTEERTKELLNYTNNIDCGGPVN